MLLLLRKKMNRQWKGENLMVFFLPPFLPSPPGFSCGSLDKSVICAKQISFALFFTLHCSSFHSEHSASIHFQEDNVSLSQQLLKQRAPNFFHVANYHFAEMLMQLWIFPRDNESHFSTNFPLTTKRLLQDKEIFFPVSSSGRKKYIEIFFFFFLSFLSTFRTWKLAHVMLDKQKASSFSSSHLCVTFHKNNSWEGTTWLGKIMFFFPSLKLEQSHQRDV